MKTHLEGNIETAAEMFDFFLSLKGQRLSVQCVSLRETHIKKLDCTDWDCRLNERLVSFSCSRHRGLVIAVLVTATRCHWFAQCKGLTFLFLFF